MTYGPEIPHDGSPKLVCRECPYAHPVDTRCPNCSHWPYAKSGAAEYQSRVYPPETPASDTVPVKRMTEGEAREWATAALGYFPGTVGSNHTIKVLRALNVILEPEPATPRIYDPNDPAWEAARDRLVERLHGIGKKDARNGYTRMANDLASGQLGYMPTWVALGEMARDGDALTTATELIRQCVALAEAGQVIPAGGLAPMRAWLHRETEK